MFFKKKGWGKSLTIALVFAFLFQCAGMVVPEPASAATTELTITKYAEDGKTIIDQLKVDYHWLMDPDNIPVLGDGETRYYHQGPVFIDEPADDPEELERLRWNEEEDRNWDTKDMGAVKGNNLKHLCNLVGGMADGEEVEIKASDGFKKRFAYKNVYNYDPDREGPMVVCWYQDGKHPDSGYTDGMRLVWFAAASSKEGPTDVAGLPSGDYHVFGNWEWHEAADSQYWYYYSGEYPTTTGLSVQNVAFINIYSNETVLTPPDLTADTENNQIGQAADITFTDDEGWRTGISRITVNGKQLTEGQYSISEATISINADVFNTPGDYKVAVSAQGYSMATVTQSMDAAPILLTAAFSADKTSGPAPLTVQFTDESAGNPTSWAWDFDNDGVVDSTEQNPFYEYTAVGTYTVKLTVTSDLDSDEEIKEGYITVTDPAPQTWYVDDSGGADFSTIQDAVTAANAGDTIIVKDGTYTENITVDKSLVIESENGAAQTIVQAANTNADVFKVTAANVTIEGFTASGATGTDKSGIKLTYISGQPSGSCTITNNVFSNNNRGITVNSNNNTVSNNTCNVCGSDGIYLSYAAGNTISDNTCANNQSGKGLNLFDSTDSNIFSSNTLDSNQMGIRIKAADTNTFNNNIISNNTTGLELATKPVGNIFYQNNFRDNTTQLSEGFNGNTENSWNSSTEISYTYKGTQYSSQLGNYWSDYTGADNDGNGIADTPYTTIASYSDNYPLIGAWQDGVITPPPVAVSGVSISEGNQELEIGQTFQLTAVVEPEDATNKNATWSSSDETVATVSETGLVTAVGEGTASITVTTEDGNFTDSITVNSIPAGPQIQLQCNSGIPGATTFISISGFNAGAAGVIWFDINDNEVFDDEEPSVAVNTDEDGAIPLLTSLTVPSVSTGDYTVRADIGGIKASAVFTVTGSGIIVSPKYGNSLEQGTTPRYITVTGNGFPASTPYRLFVDRNGNGIYDDGGYKSSNTSAEGTISVNNMSWPSSPTGIYNILLDIGRDDTIEACASIGIVPGIKISTPRGNPETNIGMNLAGFSANVDGYVWFDTNGNEVWDEDENKAAVTTTTAGGASSPGLYVPSAPPGLYQVLADIPACGLKANSVTYLIAGLVLNPGSGIVGSSIDVTGYGLVTNQTGKYIWFDSNDDGTWNEDEPRADVSTDASGTISPVSITVPEVPAGTYNVRTTVAPNTMFAVFTVNTPPSIPVTGVSITEGNQELETGQTVQLTAVVEPEDATNKNVSWSSIDEAVATVSATGLVTAVAEGTTSITVTTEDGNKTDSITVTVVEGSGGPTIDILYEGTVTLNPEETFTVTVGSNQYTIDENTPLGALQAAAEAGSFTYVLSDKRWSYDRVLLLDDVGEYERKSPGYWYAYVNDVYKDGYQNTPAGLNVIELVDGDKVEFYYAADISDPTDLNAVKAAATAAVKTVVSLSTIDVLYDGTVNLDPEEAFTVTAYNSETEYTVNENTPLGALHKAAIAGGFTYAVTDKNYGNSGALLLDNVAEYNYVKNGSAWYAYVNGALKDGYNNPDDALNLMQLADGNKVEFYYADVEDESDFNAVKAAATAAVKTTVTNGVVPTDWTLQLSGAKDETVTKAYFEQGLTCSSSHYATWTDDEGNVWGGMPLWLLVGIVDDDPDDGHFNFNDELAAAGYEVKVIAGDGWSTVLDSADIARSDAYIVANTLNGEPLPLTIGDKNKDCWPLHLKGSAISGGQQVGNIVRIELSGLPEPPAGWTLEMIGEIGDTITQKEFEEGLACTGSGHYQEWTDINDNTWSGVPLWVLLGAVDDIESGNHWTFNETRAKNYTVKVVDGSGTYFKTFAGSDVANSNDYIVANKCDGEPLTGTSAPLRLVGDGVTKDDGSLGGLAVGNIARIEILELQTPPAEPGSWNLTLKGKISDVISQAEFEEGLACPNSGHLVEWIDGDGNVWSGIPLWLLAGWVDDRQPHSYDFSQAVAGYKVLVKASDGYSVDFDSLDINRSSDYIIANKCNGAELTDTWPLRLVGSGVANAGALTGKSVGKIAEIELTSFESSGAIPDLRIVKYGEDGTTIIAEETLNYLDMIEQFDVIGDGETVYKFQGVTFDPDDMWDENETGLGGYKIANAIKGTRLSDLCSLVGDMGTGTEIVLVASDGYETRLPYSSIYPDPSVYARQGDAILAWYADGDYVPNYKDGMRLYFTPEDKVYHQMDMHETLPEAYWHYYEDNKIMYPSCAGLSAKYITTIRVYTVPQGDWKLELDGTKIGGISSDISKTYFETALACQFGANHKASYTDTKGRKWEGMPLWFLVGFVDDADQHSNEAFNDELAQSGYQVVITAGDGATVTIDSADIIRNSDYIIANLLDEFPIPETDDKWPLRLVGPAVSGSSSIGNIVSIELVSAATGNPVYTVTPVPDSTYDIGETQDGIKTMTVNAGVSGFNYFTVNIEPVFAHSGDETVVFTHLRNGSQLQINSTVADFDEVDTAQAGFNVQAGDVIKVYIVDELTNAKDHNPVILQ